MKLVQTYSKFMIWTLEIYYKECSLVQTHCWFIWTLDYLFIITTGTLFCYQFWSSCLKCSFDTYQKITSFYKFVNIIRLLSTCSKVKCQLPSYVLFLPREHFKGYMQICCNFVLFYVWIQQFCTSISFYETIKCMLTLNLCEVHVYI